MRWPVGEEAWLVWLDVALLALGLLLASWLVHRRRSRPGVAVLALVAAAYFGFTRHGCLCPVGAIQNVAQALGGGAALPLTALLLFALPLLASLFWGRVFCAGVCPLGALQELVLIRGRRVPGWLAEALGLIPFAYLGLGVLFAVGGAGYLICRWDPIVPLFRLSGNLTLLLVAVGFLLLSMVIGRPFCRFVCPLSALFRLTAPCSARRVVITPEPCVQCRLCEQACPYGAILPPTPEPGRVPRSEGRRRLLGLLLALPCLVGLGVWLGGSAGRALAPNVPDVALADRIWLEEQTRLAERTEASQAWRDRGEPVAQLYQRAAEARWRWAAGGRWFGGWLGLVLGLKLLGLAVRRQRPDYTAHAGLCVACGRCWAACPLNHDGAQRAAMLAAAPGSEP